MTRLVISAGLKFWKEILIGAMFLTGIVFFFLFFGGQDQQQPNIIDPGGKANVSPFVLQYEPLLKQYAVQYGIDLSYIPIIEALMMQESGGRGGDPMQSSESMGLPPNSIKDPVVSIQVGMKKFKDVITKAHGDIKLALQSYNFGSGFISYVNANGGKYTKGLAIAFSALEDQKYGYSQYGDVDYVDHVLQYYVSSSSFSTPPDVKPEPYFNRLMQVALQFQGMPYTWGGVSPATSFDCSGLWMYSFKQIGITLPRTAQQQYNFTQRVTKDQLKPGDFVFFTGTYNGPYITHVGIYVGNNKIFNAEDKGIGYSDLSKPYWTQHTAGYGRLTGGF